MYAVVGDAAWAKAVGEEGIEATASAAVPLPVIARAGSADQLPGGADADEGAGGVALAAGLGISTNLRVAGGADVPEREPRVDALGLSAANAGAPRASAGAAAAAAWFARLQPAWTGLLLTAVDAGQHRRVPAALADQFPGLPVSAAVCCYPAAVRALRSLRPLVTASAEGTLVGVGPYRLVAVAGGTDLWPFGKAGLAERLSVTAGDDRCRLAADAAFSPEGRVPALALGADGSAVRLTQGDLA